ncbi:hypothetical protein M0P65_05160 [Candidatus Gracilibacteria bacterium]|nr:hypothetical protein [Candidatus Gracilibacteria bacterium]
MKYKYSWHCTGNDGRHGCWHPDYEGYCVAKGENFLSEKEAIEEGEKHKAECSFSPDIINIKKQPIKQDKGRKDNILCGALSILLERERQINKENFSPERDLDYNNGQLVLAAICYANYAKLQTESKEPTKREIPKNWPWDNEWWKPDVYPQRNLEKAGALLAAEWDRIQLGIERDLKRKKRKKN